jgi:prepilin signal peptidase PulO-like enzyme (type II secretory pathway)
MITTTGLITTVVPGIALTACTITDLRSRRIPNAVTVPLAGAGLLVNLAATCVHPATSAVGFRSALLGLVACFGVMLVFHVLAGYGAGDVKLAAAIGAWVGVEAGLLCIAQASILAGLVGLGGLLTRLAARLLRRPAAAAEPGIPLAPCFAAAWGLLQLGQAPGGLPW